MIYLYNIILILVILLLLPAFFIKLIIDSRYRPGLLERLGCLPAKVKSVLQEERPVWFHAASVGEVNASEKLVSAIKARWPEKKIIVSTYTATGNAMAREKLKADAVIYLPIDIPFIVRKVMERLNPAVLIIMETEIWPNLINEANVLNAPVVLVNGRISDSSYGKYRIIKGLLRVVFSKMSLVMTQSDEYRSRFINLGADERRVQTVGNIKFDMDIKELDLKFMNNWQGPLFIAGSTREREEELILDCYVSLSKKYPDLKLVLAPRHIERANEIEGLLKEKGLQYEKRSQVKNKINAPILLLDTLGELSSIYKYASIVFIGGSLVPRGGQNLLEPALWGKPVLFGPYMENFRESAAILGEAGGGLKVRNSSELAEKVDMLLSDADYCKTTGEKAKEAVLKNQGATARTVEALARFVK